MGKQNMSLEDILNEYAPKGAAEEKKKAAPAEKPEKKASPTAVFARPLEAAAPPPRETRTLPPLTRTKVSFLQSTAMENDAMPMRVNVPSRRELEEKPSETVPVSDMPKIRRMSDSTRAKEIAKRKKKQKRGGKKLDVDRESTYERERPEGEYAYTQIHGAKKANKRRRIPGHGVDTTAVGTETLRFTASDVVPVAQPPEPVLVEPVEVTPAPRAAKTSINLSAGNTLETAEDLDVTISRSREEAEEENRRQRQLSAEMELENVAEIRSDIAELRNVISFRIMALVLVLLLSGYLSVGRLAGVELLSGLTDWMAALIQTLLGVAAGTVCVPMLKNGLKRLFTFRADTDSMAAVALIGCTAASLAVALPMGQPENPPLYMPCAIFILLVHTLGKLLSVSREETNLRLATKRFNCCGLRIVEDERRAETLTRGVLADFPVLATIQHTDSLADFRKYTYSADIADRFCRYAVPVSLCFSALAAVGVTMLRAESMVYGLMLFSMLTVAAGCAALTFVANLPLYKASRRMVRNGGMLMGYQGVDDFYDANSVMLDAASLFPDGTVKLSGVKMYTAEKREETLLSAASLSRHAGSILGNIFSEIMQGGEQKLYPVENFVYEDSMGLCGWIRSQRVLLGSRELMTSHNIEGLPSRTKEAELLRGGKDAVYLSISGSLSALFILEVTADPKVKFWAQQLAGHNVCLLLRSVDPMITLQKVSDLFGIPREVVKVLPARVQEDYEAETAPTDKLSVSAACSGGFSGVAQLLIGAKTIRKAAGIGIVIQAMSILLGLGIVLLEALLHVGLTPMWMLALQSAAAILTILVVNIRRA